jgi:hypothetical protein
MQVVVVVPVGEPVDAQRIAVKIKDRGPAGRKDLVVFRTGVVPQ